MNLTFYILYIYFFGDLATHVSILMCENNNVYIRMCNTWVNNLFLVGHVQNVVSCERR